MQSNSSSPSGNETSKELNPKDYLYDIVVEKGENLPKADIGGRIDGFIVLNFSVSKTSLKKKNKSNSKDEYKKRLKEIEEKEKRNEECESVERSCQTKAVMNNYNPIWNSRFILHHLTKETVLVELFDYDKLSENDYIGKIEVNLSEFGQSFVDSPAPLTLSEKYKDQRQNLQLPTEIFFSFGKIFTLNKIKRIITERGITDIEIDTKKRTVIKSLKNDGLDGSFFAIKYNDDYTVDFVVMSTDPNNVLYISSEEGYSKKFLAKVKREEEEFDLFGKKVKYCMVMKKIPLINPLSLFSLRKLYASSKYTLDSITTPRGWKGKLSYFQATLILKETFFIDIDERILMDEEGFIISIKDQIKTSEIAVYPKMGSPYWMALVEGKENAIILYDNGRKFDDIKDWITSKVYAQLEYPVIHKDVTLLFFEEDPDFQYKLLVDLIPYIE
ncbi:hypothetical protein EHI8A_020310 [Entamoeba histolytica HM-1:IMSS-B]|uniref:C2 domain containing protein n=4 Tax=Entamoeba histolytica TaxID=5759 RepID=C4LT08_ENTH1|nr:C2 domain containing protein [Entamoeba histolytica HM-1:IMSS]EAL52112.1 C2 domain containing protein [Entamoeba histolytica HM-1:IMSS]EMH72223.1 hypothetical protein EHI8A_020310 [Entamoeba histolytica HM-1:IMSS-B]ENY59748.1 tyrosyl-DNA phosphodiesterase, putative [Entamoeba histolytica HM-1:IMSS-A]GAT91676.1 c2 domain containing protein [Entamoeba histolytica]|eukprot:XP_657502.1 C2 domain containing protein [Entamoeba histolytica HM-1:IMSS]